MFENINVRCSHPTKQKGASMKRLSYKISFLSTVVLILLLILPITVRADGGEQGTEFTQTVDGYQVTLIFEKPAAVGKNQIHVRVYDAQNRPVSAGELVISVVKDQVEHDMESHSDTHGDVPSMSEQPVAPPPSEHAETGITHLSPSHHGGEYAGEIAIETAGDWMIRVHLTLQGEMTEVDFPLEVVQPQNGSSVLVTFFAINIAIVAVALILKPKPISVISSKGA
jgi:hypothetical protein